MLYDVYWFLFDFYWFSLVSYDYQIFSFWVLLIFIDFQRLPNFLFLGFYWFSLISYGSPICCSSNGWTDLEFEQSASRASQRTIQFQISLELDHFAWGLKLGYNSLKHWFLNQCAWCISWLALSQTAREIVALPVVWIDTTNITITICITHNIHKHCLRYLHYLH